MSIWAHAQAGYWMRALHSDVGRMFLGNERWGGQCDWPFTMYIFAKPSAKASAECSQWLVTLRQKEQRSQPTVEAKVFRLTLHVTVVLYFSLDSY